MMIADSPPPLVRTVTPPPPAVQAQVEIAATSLSDETIQFSTAGKWHVRIDPSYGASCFAMITFKDQTVLRLTVNANGGNIIVILSNPYWRTLKDGFKETIDVNMSTGENWSGVANGLRMDDRPSMAITVTDYKFMTDLAAARWVQFSWLGKTLTTLDLSDSRFAIAEIGRCQETVEKAVDPFATSPFERQQK